MEFINARNVNDAFFAGSEILVKEGIIEQSRNGPVLVYPYPVVTLFRNPTERVMLSAERDANPFFHFFEALWMLAGRDDVEFPARFNRNYTNYSDDGVSVHGAYGFRWRNHFQMDQILMVMKQLRSNHRDRRVVISMWDPNADLGRDGVDVPCNTHIYFRVRSQPHGKFLDMTVANRSNDIVWGLYGANVVHFSMLHEFMAAAINVPVGYYYHWSNNFHAYPDKYNVLRFSQTYDDRYEHEALTSPMLQPCVVEDQAVDFLYAVQEFLKFPYGDNWYDYAFLRHVAQPMLHVWEIRKNREDAYMACENILAPDWQIACREWILRRANNEEKKA